MVSKFGLLAVGIVVVIIIVAVVLFLPHILNQAGQKTALSSANNLTSLFAAAQSLYNSSGPFNISYVFHMNLPYLSVGNVPSSSSNSGDNGTFQIARYGNSIRAYSTFSAPYGNNLLHVSILMNEEAVSIYNGSYLILCDKITYTNESPVNSSIESGILSANSAPMKCTSTALVIPSFDIANTYVATPFEMSYASNFTSLEQSKGSVHSLGYRTYLGQSCLMEELIPPPNVTGSTNVSINDCVSSSNGLPLYFNAKVNGSTFVEDTISAINAAPSNANVITSLPSGAVLS